MKTVVMLRRIPALWCIVSVCVFLSSCGLRKKDQSKVGEEGLSFEYAKGLWIEEQEGYVTVEVKDPWNGGVLQRYVLVERGKERPVESLGLGTVIRVPLRRAVVYSSVHVGMMEALGVTDAIVGVCEAEYIGVETVRQRIREGAVADLGVSSSPNVERMLELETEAVIASPFRDGGYGSVEKTGIPVIELADYMEAHPLGRVEWLRFLGLLLGKEVEAEAVFKETAARYEALKSRVEGVEYRPRVFAELPYGGTWWVSPSGGYMAWLFRDAGAEYVFEDREGSEALPLSAETVLDEAIDADIWLIKYNREEPLTYTSLAGEHPSYRLFDAFKKRQVFACHTGQCPYYEEVPLHPDWLLADFIEIFHPELNGGHTLRYYTPLP
ncbi:MAG: ABC transporter substrate-binding protein [Tannerellaceae bacterium]|jgi:iron complex transport system substrate-binding protein|nr:ABC transporter substrate-binding protein [Tannerellaceae bacterium]